MNRWLVVALCVLVLLIGGGVVLSLRNEPPAGSRVEHRGNTLIIYGRGSEADLGYLAAGRYELTVDQDYDGCADGLTLIGDDGVKRFWLNPSLINYRDFGTIREFPGQHYLLHVDVYFGGSGLGPRTTPSPLSVCTWVFELAPA
jgi:hypothetical protein